MDKGCYLNNKIIYYLIKSITPIDFIYQYDNTELE